MGTYILADMVGPDNNYADEAAKQEQKRQRAIREGTSYIDAAYAQFNPEFYQQRANAYYQNAMPQLAGQYGQYSRQTGYNLANRGLLKSGAAKQQWSALNKTNLQAKQNIANEGVSQAQTLQQQIESMRDSLLNQLYESADPASAAQRATATAASFQYPSTSAALADQFQNIASQYYLAQLINAQKNVGANNGYEWSDTSGAFPATTVGGGR